MSASEDKSTKPEDKSQRTLFIRLPRFLSDEQVRSRFSSLPGYSGMAYQSFKGRAFLFFSAAADAQSAISLISGTWRVTPARDRNPTEVNWPLKAVVARPRRPYSSRPPFGGRGRRFVRGGGAPRGMGRSYGGRGRGPRYGGGWRRPPPGRFGMQRRKESKAVVLEVPRFATLEQVRDHLLKGFPPCELKLLGERSGGRPAICIAEFGSVEDARESILQINGYKWKLVPGNPEESKEIVWTVRARFGRDIPAGKPQQEKKEQEGGKDSETDVVLEHLPEQVDRDNVGDVMEGFEFEVLSLRPSGVDGKEKTAVLRLESHEEQLRAIRDVDGTKVEENTIVVRAAKVK